MPRRNNFLINNLDSEENKENIEEEEEESEDFFDVRKKLEEKEKELRNNLKELFEKDRKFIEYIPIYLWGKLEIYIKENENKIKNQISLLKKKLKQKNLLYLKLIKIQKIISTFKLYSFDIKKDFENFVLKNQEFLPKKKSKQEKGNEVVQSISNFEYFINKIKEYAGNTEDTVELSGEEPNQFVFNLFLEKIGLN